MSIPEADKISTEDAVWKASAQPIVKAAPPIAITSAIERALVMGELNSMNADQRVNFYNAVCQSVGLNPLTRPLEYIILNGKLTLYARKDCTEQLRRRDRVAVKILSREVVDDCYVVTAAAATPDGRTDESIGSVFIGGLKGEAKANAIMKAETKAKRRVTLSICGLGILDETEAEPRNPRRGNYHFETKAEVPAQLEAGNPAADETPTSDLQPPIDEFSRDVQVICMDCGVAFEDVVAQVKKQGFISLEMVPAEKREKVLDWIRAKSKPAKSA